MRATVAATSLDALLDGLQDVAGVRAQARFTFAAASPCRAVIGRDGVVDVVSDAARHLPQHAQPLLLHHGLLRSRAGPRRPPAGPVQLRLMGGQRHVLAQLPQELAFAAAEAAGPRGARRSVRRRPGSRSAAARPPARAGRRPRAAAETRRCLELAMSGSYTSCSLHAARQTVLIDRDPCVLASSASSLGHGSDLPRPPRSR